jgi:hypothetical protein
LCTDFAENPGAITRGFFVKAFVKRFSPIHVLQVGIRHMERTLTDEEANTVRNKIYLILHQGEKQEPATNK